MADAEHHLVLTFSLSTTKSDALHARIKALSAALPDHTVFNSGGDNANQSITIKLVVTRKMVLMNADVIGAAADAYIASCQTMMAGYKIGRVSRDWTCQKHGGHVRFTHRKSGQIIEAPLAGITSVNSVDPFFFAEFVKSTSGHEVAAGLINDCYHDAARMLEVLTEQRGS
ncbi:MAG: hypothetical protein NTW19_23610 [Planctomycetota bacterium]|nr:hypothetical protein [Planctomycetota bacterium]